MRNTPLGTGLSCRPNRHSVLKASIFLIFLLSRFLTAQTQVQWSQSGNNIYNPNTGNVGIGTSTPNAKLEVDGNLLFLPPATGQFYIVNGITVDPLKAGIRCNAGGAIFNAGGTPASPGKLFFNRDVYADTWIESTPDGGNTSVEIATFKANGFVGINTTTPRTTLDVNGTFYMNRPAAMGDAESTLGIPAGSYLGIAPSDISAANPGYVLFLYPDHNSFRIGTNYDGHLGSPVYQDLQFGRYTGDAYMTIKDGGNVLIGKTSQANTGYKLDVNGNVRANQVVVNTSGADFVFDPRYHLPSLKELGAYVRREHHLPDIAPAAQMQKEGVDLGANQTRLLQKVEELTLYTIQQDKQMDSLKDKVRRLEEQNSRLEDLLKRIERLEHSQNPTLDK